jgi:hypothetical protein
MRNPIQRSVRVVLFAKTEKLNVRASGATLSNCSPLTL